MFLARRHQLNGAAAKIDPVTYAMLLEEIAAGGRIGLPPWCRCINSPTCIVVNNYGNDAQKDHWLRKLATGEHVGSFGLTEPQAGSDASALKTRAVKRGDRYIINGAKQFISNASHPGSLVFFAVTDPTAGKKGLSAFVIDKSHPGFSVARVEEKLGQKASDTCALTFEDMEVPEDPAHRRGRRGLQDRFVYPGVRAHRHRSAERRHGAGRAGVRGGVCARQEGVRRGDHRLPGRRLPPR